MSKNQNNGQINEANRTFKEIVSKLLGNDSFRLKDRMQKSDDQSQFNWGELEEDFKYVNRDK